MMDYDILIHSDFRGLNVVAGLGSFFVFCRLILHELLDRGRSLFDSSSLIPLGAQQSFLSLSGALSKPELIVKQCS